MIGLMRMTLILVQGLQTRCPETLSLQTGFSAHHYLQNVLYFSRGRVVHVFFRNLFTLRPHGESRNGTRWDEYAFLALRVSPTEFLTVNYNQAWVMSGVPHGHGGYCGITRLDFWVTLLKRSRGDQQRITVRSLVFLHGRYTSYVLHTD